MQGQTHVLLWLSESESVEPLKMRNNGKKALTREAGTHSDIEYVAELEKEMLEKLIIWV